MHGGLSQQGLRKLEIQIDELLNGRDPKSLDLEKPLINLIGKYSYEVEYHNTLHKKNPYLNKYGTPTPLGHRSGLSLANFRINGIPSESENTAIPDGRHLVTTKSMDSFIKSFESFLQGHPSRQDAANLISLDPHPEKLIESVEHEICRYRKV